MIGTNQNTAWYHSRHGRAEMRGIVYRSAKPLPFALMVARRRMGVKRKQMAMVGGGSLW